MATFTFHFDDVKATLNGKAVLVAGSFDVSYSWLGADPSVGIFEGNVEDVYIDSKSFEVTVMDDDGNDLPPFTFVRGTPEFEALESALDAKMQEKANDAANEPKDDRY